MGIQSIHQTRRSETARVLFTHSAVFDVVGSAPLIMNTHQPPAAAPFLGVLSGSLARRLLDGCYCCYIFCAVFLFVELRIRALPVTGFLLSVKPTLRLILISSSCSSSTRRSHGRGELLLLLLPLLPLPLLLQLIIIVDLEGLLWV